MKAVNSQLFVLKHLTTRSSPDVLIKRIVCDVCADEPDISPLFETTKLLWEAEFITLVGSNKLLREAELISLVGTDKLFREEQHIPFRGIPHKQVWNIKKSTIFFNYSVFEY